ncbi:glycosyl hydrolase family 25 protein [Flyfo myovirus Tbat2_7]|nr:glycosyl hydrolase family 25 protein [Flyfo myovirus Tbat2_7]
MTLNVTDISGNNPNYASFIKNYDAIIIKISEGISYINPLANAQYQAAKKAGKRLGFYHFVVGGIDARKQAEYFYNNASNYLNEKGSLLVFDFEQPNGYPNLIGDEPKAFLDRLYELTGKRGLLYIGHQDVVSSKYDWSDIKGTYALWVAGYPLNNGTAYSSDLQQWADQNYFSNAAYNGQVVAMWQFDSVPHDRSIAYMDGAAWDKYGTKVGGNNNNSSPFKQDKTFKENEKVKLKGYAYASYYGTKFDSSVKSSVGWIATTTDIKKLQSTQLLRVGFVYNDKVNYWNVYGQDIENV